MLYNSKEKTILFDLDGTLIDHFQAIYRCFLHAAEQLGLPELDYNAVKASIGGALHLSIEELIGKENAEKAVTIFRDYYEKILLEDLYLMPGTTELLSFLHSHNYKICLFTNKPTGYSETILKEFNLFHYFTHVIGTTGDNHSPLKKPYKEFTEYTLDKVGASPSSAILIGDSHYDIDAAHCVGMPVYIVTSGTHSKDDILSHKNQPQGIFADLYDLGHELFGMPKPLQKDPHPELAYLP